MSGLFQNRHGPFQGRNARSLTRKVKFRSSVVANANAATSTRTRIFRLFPSRNNLTVQAQRIPGFLRRCDMLFFSLPGESRAKHDVRSFYEIILVIQGKQRSTGDTNFIKYLSADTHWIHLHRVGVNQSSHLCELSRRWGCNICTYEP